jgi:hypothetical protein
MTAMSPERLLEFQKKLADEGRLVEAGWMGFRIAVVHRDATPFQLEEMRMAFMGGAMHLFASITSILDDGDDATEADLSRLSLINDELQKFAGEMIARAKRMQP